MSKPYVAFKTSLVKTSYKTKSCNCRTDETVLQRWQLSSGYFKYTGVQRTRNLNTFYFCSILPCSVAKWKKKKSVYFTCVNTFASFMPWAAILKDLEAQPSGVVNEKKWAFKLHLIPWLTWAPQVVQSSEPCLTVLTWVCACSGQRMCPSQLGRKAEKTAVKTSCLFSLKKKVNFALNWGHNSTAAPASCSRFEI